jgi:glycosyltransferase involved in cell wall biosynthesis
VTTMPVPPYVAGVDKAVARPAISVVIPTYEPERFLVDTVRSVLAQDPGPAQMQIAIVDDGSTSMRAAAVLTGVAPADRIEYYEHADRLGLASNWNRAIAHARGEYVHILHQDDTVHPEFYAALLSGLRSSRRIGMGFCRHAFIDESGRVERISHRERWRAGVLLRWLDRISERQRLQCPAAIVRRDVYETLGGFRADLHYALDWEMWVRIASAYDVWYEPRVLASYRRHRGTETARLEAIDRTTADTMSAIAVLSMHLPPARRARLQQRAYLRLARVQAKRAAKLLDSGLPQLAAKQLEGAQAAMVRLPENLAKRWLRSRLARTELRLANGTSQTSI